MTQAREREIPVSALDRAEQTLTRAGKQLGHLAGRTSVRLRQATRAWRAEADQLDMPASTPAQTRSISAQPASAKQHTRERAEEIVDQLGERVSRWTLGGSMSVQRTAARLREDAEDMWIEAQELQKEWRGKREHAAR